MSQPALSRQIRALERLVGCDLLRRSTHRVELTIAGEALLDRTRDLLHNLDDAVTATRSVGGELAGRAARMWDSVEAAVIGEYLEEARTAYEAIQEQFEPPAEIEIRSVSAGGALLLLGRGPARHRRSCTCTAAGTCSARRSGTARWSVRSRPPRTPPCCT